MENFGNSAAWLAKRDGSLVVGHGPFEESAEAPTDSTSFYIQDFALQDSRPWKTPSSIERTTREEMARRLEGNP